jgi:hypothetical protein
LVLDGVSCLEKVPPASMYLVAEHAAWLHGNDARNCGMSNAHPQPPTLKEPDLSNLVVSSQRHKVGIQLQACDLVEICTYGLVQCI